MKTWAYVFITTSKPRAVVQASRKLPGVVKADGLFGTPDAIVLAEGEDLAELDVVIDRIVALPEVASTDTKVARWIE